MIYKIEFFKSIYTLELRKKTLKKIPFHRGYLYIKRTLKIGP